MGNLVAGLGFGNMMGASTALGAANLAGSLWTTNEAEKEAQANREWQQGMSGSAHQREVADLQAAGLNPMLSVMHPGATTPGGATATPAGGNPAAAGIDTALSAATTGAQISVANAQADKLAAEAAESRARTPTYAVSMDQMQQQIEQSKAAVDNLRQLTLTSAASAKEIAERTTTIAKSREVMDATMQQLRSQAALNDQQVSNLTTEQREMVQRIKVNLPAFEAAYKDIRNKLEAYQLPGARQTAEVHTGAQGGNEMFGRFGALLNVIMRGK